MEVDADRVPLNESPALAHVAAVMKDARLPAGRWVRDAVAPLAAPDPRARLQATHAGNPAAGGVPLRVVTWNLALLDATLFGFIPYKKSPMLAERRPLLVERITNSDADILLLQEVWLESDRLLIETAAMAAGFLCFHGPRRRYSDGVITLVRRTLVVGGPAAMGKAYDDADPREFFPGPRIRRGYVEVAFTHPEIGPMRVLNTHLLAWPKNWPIRLREVRELGLRARSAPSEALVLVGGDLNAAPYYPRDVWVHPDGRREPGWWGNALSWAALQHYGGLVDLTVRGISDPGLDVDLLNAMAPAPDGRMDVRAYAALTRHPRHFTATDENRLYAMQYLGTEYPSRIDQLFARDPQGRVHVASVQPRHAEVVPSVGVEASDHVGVELLLSVRP